MRHVVNYSGGNASRLTAEFVAEESGTETLTLVFADVFVEAPGLYHSVIESAASVFRLPKPEDLCARALALPPLKEMDARKAALKELARDTMARVPGLAWIWEGRTPWEVFRDKKFIGNTRVDICSRVLKRELIDCHINAHFDRTGTIRYFGLDANEGHRLNAVEMRLNADWYFLLLLSYLLFTHAGIYYAPRARPLWRVRSPLHERGVWKESIPAELARPGLTRSDSYALGFHTDNCFGACVKAGQGQWLKLLHKRPEVYAYAEAEEQRCFEVIGRDDVGVLRDRTGGETERISLKTFREQIEGGAQIDLFDIGGCGCGV